MVASLHRNRHSAKAEAFHRRNAERYTEYLGHSRGALMKAGQILSMVIPESGEDGQYRGIYQAAFARLQDSAPPMPTELAVETVETELGRPLSEVFATFEPEPLAAASIGQVHAATLHDGTGVVVKVQYPGVQEAIRADLANTELLGTFLQMLLFVVPLSKTDVRGMAKEIAERIGEEIDYLTEAANQQEFAEAYRGHPFIRIPKVHDELTTHRVLTMQHVDGMRYAQAARAELPLRDRWGEAIYRFLYGSLSKLGLVNADAHPGNYLFHPDGSVTFLDFGCVKRLTPPQVDTLVELFRHLASQDAEALHRYAIEAGYIRAADVPDADRLAAFLLLSQPHLTAPQPFTFTPELMAALTRDALKESNREVMRKLSSPAFLTMINRVGTGTFAVLGGLRATGDWKSVWAECCEGEPPFTAYGRLDTEFWASKP
ncbi:MAG TPA: AarF/ABC1/UbiB kinase family protein [Sporichthyaceae bacterium]|nr:AarF/ABC1/UbiB kinase family protein [Sporichthyaceae bacterium]